MLTYHSAYACPLKSQQIRTVKINWRGPLNWVEGFLINMFCGIVEELKIHFICLIKLMARLTISFYIFFFGKKKMGEVYVFGISIKNLWKHFLCNAD